MVDGTQRRQQIIRLLETRHDHLPGISRAEISGAQGFAHRMKTRVDCPDCLANDRRMYGCETCGGRGYTEEYRERDPMAENKPMLAGANGSQHDASYARDAEIRRLDAQIRETVDELADADAHPYQWERARQVAYRDYDYAALDLALEALRMVDDVAASMLVRVFEYQLVPEPYHGTLAARVLENALTFVSDLMPDPVRAPAPDQPVRLAVGRVQRTAGRTALADRNAQIRAAIDAGEPTTVVAKRWGLSVRQVNRAYQQGEAA